MLVKSVEQLEFDPELRTYDEWLSDAPPSALVRAFPLEPDALVYVNVQNEAGHTNLMAAAVGGGEVGGLASALGWAQLWEALGTVIVRTPSSKSVFMPAAATGLGSISARE